MNRNLLELYTPAGPAYLYLLWQFYDPPAELVAAAEKLYSCEVDSVAEYLEQYRIGLPLAMEYSPRVWLTFKPPTN